MTNPTLRSALEPFAKAADKHDGWADGSYVDVITVGDLRRAREAYEAIPTTAGDAGAFKPWHETDALRDLARILPEMESKIADAERIYDHCLPKHLFAPLRSSITELMVLRHELAANPAPPNPLEREAVRAATFIEERPDDRGNFDEVVANFADGTFHIEALSSKSVFLTASRGEEYFSIWISSDKKLTYTTESETAPPTAEEPVGETFETIFDYIDPIPASGGVIQADKAKRQFELWFFRDLSDEQRLGLIRLICGDGIAKECGPTHGYQRHALKIIFRALKSHPQDGGSQG